MEIIGLATLAFLLAGAIKGTVGIGLPTAALGAITLGLDPRTAITLILFPMLATNAWQAFTPVIYGERHSVTGG